MIEQLFQRENYVVAKKMLDAAHDRHQAISSNIANVETPGYKRQDVSADFATEMQKLAKAGDLQKIQQLTPKLVNDLNSPSVRADGNNVQIDNELLKMATNATEYEFLAKYTSNSLNRLKTAITGQVR